jgi:aconitate hydratase
VAFALAGSIKKDLTREAIGLDADGKPVYLKDIWPSQEEVNAAVRAYVQAELFKKANESVFQGDAEWKRIPAPKGDLFDWAADSTYIRRASFLENLPAQPPSIGNITGARVLALLGDMVTTDHISPASSIAEKSPAGQYLLSHGVKKADFNSYGARRGNHEVMIRGTFANVRLKNLLAPGTEGGVTTKFPAGTFPEGTVTSIYEAAMAYAKEKTPLVVLAGKEYGSGSSRDWAAKGTAMLGIKAVIAESFERIHRSNLVMMGILPLQFIEGQNASSLGLTGAEVFDIAGIEDGLSPFKTLKVKAVSGGRAIEFSVMMRIDTPKEIDYYLNGGILPFVLRQMREEKK